MKPTPFARVVVLHLYTPVCEKLLFRVVEAVIENRRASPFVKCLPRAVSEVSHTGCILVRRSAKWYGCTVLCGSVTFFLKQNLDFAFNWCSATLQRQFILMHHELHAMQMSWERGEDNAKWCHVSIQVREFGLSFTAGWKVLWCCRDCWWGEGV